MNILDEIIKEHSKQNTLRVASLVGNDKRLIQQLVEITLSKKAETARKAAWVLRCNFEINPDAYSEYFPLFIRHLKKRNIHDAVKRNILGILKAADIPDQYKGELLDICFHFIESATEAVAVKAFSMDIVMKIASGEPSLMNELKLILEDLLPYSTAGIKSKAKQLISDKRNKPKKYEK